MKQNKEKFEIFSGALAYVGIFFDTSKQGVGQHIANMLNERELDANSVVKDYLTTEQLSEYIG